MTTATGKGKLAIGLLGAGRLGRVYARDLASRIAETKLVAIADPVGVAGERGGGGVRRAEVLRRSVRADRRSGGGRPRHRQPDRHASRAGARRGGAEEADVLREAAVDRARFRRRDAGRRSRSPACSSRWGSCGGSTPAMPRRKSRSTRGASACRWSSSPRRAIRSGPSLEYANPKSSGGMLLDMGIHDFDLARWFMGEVKSVADDRRDDRLSRAGDGRRHRQRDLEPGVRQRQARRRRSDAQRHLRLRHLDGDSRPRGHA